MFQTLIGILQTNLLDYLQNARVSLFQTLIDILQTALFLALFKLLSSFLPSFFVPLPVDLLQQGVTHGSTGFVSCKILPKNLSIA